MLINSVVNASVILVNSVFNTSVVLMDSDLNISVVLIISIYLPVSSLSLVSIDDRKESVVKLPAV